MIRHPLEYGIREEKVGRRIRSPSRQVGLHKRAAGKPLARLPKHVVRRVEADHLGLREPLDEQLGRITRPAAEIDDTAGSGERHLRQQVARRTRALILKFQVLARAPVVHASIANSRYGTELTYESRGITLTIKYYIRRTTMATTVTVKGQVTLPKSVRDAAGIKPGDKVEVRATASGGVYIEKRGTSSAYGKRLLALAERRLIRGATTDQIMRELRGDPARDPKL